LNLDAAVAIIRPAAIQISRQGKARAPSLREALALALGALGTLGRSSGVKTLNTEINGLPVAMALIEGARFDRDENGHTTLATALET
jgi:hypothetical protein